MRGVPVTTYISRTWCTTIGQVLAYFDFLFFNPFGLSSTYIHDVTPLSLDGFLGWQLIIETGDNVEKIQCVCINATEEHPYPIFACILENALRTIGTVQVNLVTHPGYTFADFEAWMSSDYLELKVAIIEAMTLQTVSVLDISSLTVSGDNQGTVNVVMQVNDGMTYYTVTDTYALGIFDGEVVHQNDVKVIGTSLASAPAQVGQSLARIEESLEDIATLDMDVGFNHGDQVVSIRGRAKTGV